MRDLRTLLIDCRIALRGAAADSGREQLTERIDEAIQELVKAGAPVEAPRAKPSVAHKVALAWQSAARSLKISHPELYDQLSERVMGILDTRNLDEPTDELLRLGGEVEKLRKDATWAHGELDRLQARAEQAQEALEELRRGLAEAVPDLSLGDDPQQFALICLQELVRASKRTGPGLKGEATPAEESAVPAKTLVAQVAAGVTKFNSAQRDWIISEAMTLTGWEFTPIELIEKGDRWLAKLMLDKGNLDEAEP